MYNNAFSTVQEGTRIEFISKNCLPLDSVTLILLIDSHVEHLYILLVFSEEAAGRKLYWILALKNKCGHWPECERSSLCKLKLLMCHLLEAAKHVFLTSEQKWWCHAEVGDMTRNMRQDAVNVSCTVPLIPQQLSNLMSRLVWCFCVNHWMSCFTANWIFMQCLCFQLLGI